MAQKRSPGPRAPEATHTRRALLKAAAASTAAIGFMAAPGGGGGIATARTSLPEDMGSPVLAYVSDLGRGEITVMVGTTEVVRRDTALAARIIALAKEARDVVTS